MSSQLDGGSRLQASSNADSPNWQPPQTFTTVAAALVAVLAGVWSTRLLISLVHTVGKGVAR